MDSYELGPVRLSVLPYLISAPRSLKKKVHQREKRGKTIRGFTFDLTLETSNGI